MHEVLGSPHKLSVLVHTYNPSTRERKSERIGNSRLPWLRNKFEASLGYMKKKPKSQKVLITMFQFSLIKSI